MPDEEEAVDTPVGASSSWFERTKAILIAGAKEFGADKAGRMAAALAYYTLFSLVPLLFVAVAVTTIALGPDAGQLPEDCSSVVDEPLGNRPLDQVVKEIRRTAGDAVADPVRVIMCGSRKSASSALGIGLVVAAFSASGIFLQVQGVLQSIFNTPPEHTAGIGGMVRQRLVALASAIVLAVLVLVPVVAVAAIRYAIDLLPAEVDWLSLIHI